MIIIAALSKLLTSLRENKTEIPNCTDEEFGFLNDLLRSKELNALVNVHNKILSNVKDDKFYPVLSNSMDIDVEVLDMLSTKTHISDEHKELFHLLQKPHIQVYKLHYSDNNSVCACVLNVTLTYEGNLIKRLEITFSLFHFVKKNVMEKVAFSNLLSLKSLRVI